MDTRRWLAVTGVVAALVFGGQAAFAFHTQFLYRVDRFEADGNALGAYDGVADVVDEFSAAPLDPYFLDSVRLPTGSPVAINSLTTA
jgi:hypothetical protein